MTIQCSCGCGKELTDKECVMREVGGVRFLETMRTECREAGESVSDGVDLVRLWDSILELEGLGKIEE